MYNLTNFKYFDNLVILAGSTVLSLNSVLIRCIDLVSEGLIGQCGNVDLF